MSSRFLCADLNNVFYAHGGVQNPCYRSIVSNTDTFEMMGSAVQLLIDQALTA